VNEKFLWLAADWAAALFMLGCCLIRILSLVMQSM